MRVFSGIVERWLRLKEFIRKVTACHPKATFEGSSAVQMRHRIPSDTLLGKCYARHGPVMASVNPSC